MAMSEIYDQSHTDVVFRRDVANAIAVGFEVPKTLNVTKPKPKAPKQPKRQNWALSDATAEVAPR